MTERTRADRTRRLAPASRTPAVALAAWPRRLALAASRTPAVALAALAALAACAAEPAAPAAPPGPLAAAVLAPPDPAPRPAVDAGPAPRPAVDAGPAPLRHHTVDADGHPLAVHARRPARPRAAVLLVHGRTWSGLPDFDLHAPGAGVSLMAALAAADIAAYAVDLRGYGATPRDATGFLTPSRAAADVAAALRFVEADAGAGRPYLLGWSLGARVAAKVAQTRPDAAAGLVLYGYPCSAGRPAPPTPDPEAPRRAANTAAAAASDFITPGAASPAVVEAFVAAALAADPVRADWRGGAEWDALRFAELRTPVLVIHGEHDPVTDPRCMADRFRELRGVDRRWEVLAGGDHAAHLERTAPTFVAAVVRFVTDARAPSP